MTFQTEKSDDALSGAVEHTSFVTFEDSNFNKYWRQFLENYEIYSFRYNLETIDYYKLLMGSKLMDKSFVLINTLEDVPIAICPLIIAFDEKITASYSRLGSKFLPIPLFHKKLSKKQKNLAGKRCADYLQSLFQDLHVKRWYTEATVNDIELISLEETLPAAMEAMDVSIQNHLLKVDIPDDEIKLQIRSRVRKEINQGLKLYEFRVWDQHNYLAEVGDRHRNLHHKTSGRVTRPIETFLRSYEWIKEGKGLMFEQLYQGQTVNMTLLSLGGKIAYGASTADEPDFEASCPLMPAMLWKIAIELRSRGFTHYETGATNNRDSIHEFLTPKEKNIIFFKKGFGNITFPFKKWIWFSDKKEEVIYLEDAILKFKSHFLK